MSERHYTEADVKVRMATNADGWRLAELAALYRWNQWLDWDNNEPYWMVAEIDGDIVGAIQNCPGRPIGRTEMLMIQNSIPKLAKRSVCIALGREVQAFHRANGAQMVTAMVSFKDKKFKRWLKAGFGIWVYGQGNLMAGVVAEKPSRNGLPSV